MFLSESEKFTVKFNDSWVDPWQDVIIEHAISLSTNFYLVQEVLELVAFSFFFNKIPNRFGLYFCIHNDENEFRSLFILQEK